MTLKELQSLLRSAFCQILRENPAGNTVRVSYPVDGSPGFKINENVLFLYLHEADDRYAHDRQPVYYEKNDTVYRDHVGTRVWDCILTAYGPDCYEWLDKIRSGVLWEATRRMLGLKDVFLVPTNPTINRVPELANGQWWPRCDMVLRYNELHVDSERVGHIEEVNITIPGEVVSKTLSDETGTINKSDFKETVKKGN